MNSISVSSSQRKSRRWLISAGSDQRERPGYELEGERYADEPWSATLHVLHVTRSAQPTSAPDASEVGRNYANRVHDAPSRIAPADRMPHAAQGKCHQQAEAGRA